MLRLPPCRGERRSPDSFQRHALRKQQCGERKQYENIHEWYPPRNRLRLMPLLARSFRCEAIVSALYLQTLLFRVTPNCFPYVPRMMTPYVSSSSLIGAGVLLLSSLLFGLRCRELEILLAESSGRSSQSASIPQSSVDSDARLSSSAH